MAEAVGGGVAGAVDSASIVVAAAAAAAAAVAAEAVTSAAHDRADASAFVVDGRSAFTSTSSSLVAQPLPSAIVPVSKAITKLKGDCDEVKTTQSPGLLPLPVEPLGFFEDDSEAPFVPMASESGHLIEDARSRTEALVSLSNSNAQESPGPTPQVCSQDSDGERLFLDFSLSRVECDARTSSNHSVAVEPQRLSCTLRMRDAWCNCECVTACTSVHLTSGGRKAFSDDKVILDPLSDRAIEERVPLMMIRPTSALRITWDLCALVLMGYDLVTIPLQVFDPPETTWSSILAKFFLIFWCIDIIATFFVGYHSEGQLVMSPARVARRYFTSWFVVDVLLVGADLYTILYGEGGGVEVRGIGRAFRVARGIRMLRLIRLLKWRHVVDKSLDLINSEHTFVLVGMCRVLCVILMASHVASCGWYFVGTACTPKGGTSWVVASGVQDEGFFYQYMTCLHYVLCLFTPASIDVHPRNAAERIAAVTLLLAFLITIPSLVSTVTANMTTLRKGAADEWRRCWVLRRYLKQRGASKDLSVRMLKNVEFVHRQRRGNILESSVEDFELISESLRQELQYEINSAKLSVHPFLKLLFNSHTLAAHRICSVALAHHELAVHDTLFTRGAPAHCSHFITVGTASYELVGIKHLVKERDWLSETAVWSSWRHVGNLMAAADCTFVSLVADRFSEVLRGYPAAWAATAKYAERYMEHISRLSGLQLNDLRCSESFFNETLGAIGQTSISVLSFVSHAMGHRLSGRSNYASSVGMAPVSKLPRVLGSQGLNLERHKK
eukprot:TRINITY_DN12808_c1_g1_i1.p1 TRINITY_DN12808_c1_g1~~TRINITY_DN12808_c1_g1_i1.p1  ORF type:complete len:860 (-),score=123.47 TRINITY_DN12808_c1_g1_i1:176-2527(-)